MKNINKISLIIIILFVISIIFSNNVQAIGDIFSDADNFLLEGDSIGSKIDEGQLKETSNFMYKLLMAIGIIVMFIVGTILGIQYMVASAEDKAKVKESLVPYIVGCFVIFGAFTIWSIAVNIGQDMTGTGALPSTTYTLREICGNCGETLTQEDKQIMSSTHACPYCRQETNIPRVYVCNNCSAVTSEYDYLNNKKCSGCGLLLSN